jgi:hypothetical protein
MIVSLNGVIQKPTDAYTVSSSTITFASNLVTGDVIDFIQILGNVLDLGVPSDSTVSLAKLTATGTKDATTFLRGDNTFASAQGIFESELLHVRDEKSSGTNGGSGSAGANNTRDLNTVVTNEITGASLGSNQITLAAGTYYIDASAPAYRCNRNHAYLYNVTDSANQIIGTAEYSLVASSVTSKSCITGRFTINAQKVFSIKQNFEDANANANGVSTGVSNHNSIYTNVSIWKVA